MGKSQQWLHAERSLGRALLLSGCVSAIAACGEDPGAGLAAKWLSVSTDYM